MIRIWGLLVLNLLVLGCASRQAEEFPDSMPGDAMRVLRTTPEVREPTAAMARKSGMSLDRLGRGYSVFMRKCVECHEPRMAVDPDDPSWHPTMIGMAWNAGLEKGEEEAVVDYMRAAAR